LVTGGVRAPVAKKDGVKSLDLLQCCENKFTVCEAENNDASPSRRPFIKFHLKKDATSQSPTITALYDTGAAVTNEVQNCKMCKMCKNASFFLPPFQMKLWRHKAISRFGLMHMIATNICVWFNVLILETFHEISNTR
jgi:hypothetical protein